jgi:hypothetical protein
MFTPVLTSTLLLVSPYVPVFPCTAVSSSCYVVFSVVNISGVPVAASQLLLTSLLILRFPPALASLLLLASLALPIFPCSAVELAVDVHLMAKCAARRTPLRLRLWFYIVQGLKNSVQKNSLSMANGGINIFNL